MGHESDALFGATGSWRERLDDVVAMAREMSRQTEPEAMVRAYASRIARMLPRDRFISLSRRGHQFPEFRITRDSTWTHPPDAWSELDKQPHLRGGLLADLIYGDQPRIITDLSLPADDPAAEYLAGLRSLMALPLYDDGVALNMVLVLRKKPNAFRPEALPEQTWLSNLFGIATQNLVLSAELRRAYAAVDQELQAVAEIQRSLLPETLPQIETLDLAAHYETSRRAGGDYYDLFRLSAGKWGILIADVSGHGTPAAVIMAILHTLAHGYPDAPEPPQAFLQRLNQQLCSRYTRDGGTFVTAFYAIYDPGRRQLVYASAGHEPPRLKRCVNGSLWALDAAQGLPLGISAAEEYPQAQQQLEIGDQIIFYTDGITEAFNPQHEMFGVERLDAVLEDCAVTAEGLINEVLGRVQEFTNGHPADDDRTLFVAKVR